MPTHGKGNEYINSIMGTRWAKTRPHMLTVAASAVEERAIAMRAAEIFILSGRYYSDGGNNYEGRCRSIDRGNLSGL